jgi:dihydropyrimidine dehydrogenase (NAD+) subunit PreA
VQIPVAGVGGVVTWKDAVEFLLAGAGIVQVCTAVMRYGYDIVEELNEALSREYRVVSAIDEDLCIGCGACVIACRDGGHQALEFRGRQEGGGLSDADDARIPEVDDEKCIGCGFCETVCPVDRCITMAEKAPEA